MKENKELQDHEDELKAKAEHLREREQSIERRETILGLSHRPLSKAEQKLIDEGIKVYKIPREYLFSSGIDQNTGEAVLVTSGGKKIKYRKGEDAKCKLTEVEITGKIQKEPMIWHEKLNQRISLKKLLKL